MKKLFILAIPIILIGCFPKAERAISGAIKQAVESSTESDFQWVQEPRVVKTEYGKAIKGTIKNISGKTYSLVSIDINIYDKEGAQIGTTMANTSNLAAGGIWKWEAPVLEDEGDSFKVTGFTAF